MYHTMKHREVRVTAIFNWNIWGYSRIDAWHFSFDYRLFRFYI